MIGRIRPEEDPGPTPYLEGSLVVRPVQRHSLGVGRVGHISSAEDDVGVLYNVVLHAVPLICGTQGVWLGIEE